MEKELTEKPEQNIEGLKEPENLSESALPIVDVSKELKEVVGTMPEVVLDAIQAAQEKEEKTVKENQEIKDIRGVKFDPAIHAVDKEGKPILTPKGKFSKIKIQRSSLILPQAAGAGASATEQEDISSLAEIKAYATIWTDLFINFGISLFGEEWTPEKKAGYDERASLITMHEQFMLEYGIVKAPAWAVLLLGYGTYALKRINQPKTKSAFERLRLWAKNSMLSAWLWIQNKSFKGIKKADEAEIKK